MNTIKTSFKTNMGIFILLLFISSQTFSQQFNLNNEASKLIISGTSSLHDWDINAEQQKGQLTLDIKDQLQIQKIKIEIVTESLKSGKGGMDKNTYKALNAKDHKNITFDYVETKDVTQMGDGKYKVKCLGNLTVAGVTQKIDLDLTLEVTSNKASLKGEKAIKMTHYDIEPPKALFGTITTGDAITIKFDTVFSK